MKLIIGLGNPEEKYTNTRHNVGFRMLSAFAAQHSASFTLKDKFHASVAEVIVNGEKVILLQPTTYYNSSGEAYRAVSDFYKITPEDTLVIHDELALPFGTIRTRIGGSDAGNNGVKSVNQHGGEQTARVRVGIASEQRALMGDTNFVLGRLSADEQAQFDKTLLPKVIELMHEFIADDHKVTSHSLVPKLTE